MSDIAPVSGVPGDRFDIAPLPGERPAYRPEPPAPLAAPDADRPARPSDGVELSDRARLLSKLASLPDIRQDLVDRIRRQIAAGSYDTPDKMDRALEALVQDLELEG